MIKESYRSSGIRFGLAIVFVSSVSQAQSFLPIPALGLPKGNHPALSSPALRELPAPMRNRALTINDVVAIAMSTNRNLALQFEAYLQSRGVTTTARAGLGPRLSANYVYDAYTNSVVSQIGGQNVVVSEQYQSQYTAQLSLPIDITGELKAAVSQAKYQEIAARLDINRERNQLVLDVKNAFYTVLKDQALVKVGEDALQNAVDRLADTELRVEAGTAARYDLTTSKSDVASAQQTLIADRGSLSQAFASLNNTIGINVDTPLELTTEGAVTTPASATLPYSPPNLNPSKPPEENLQIGANGLVGDAGKSLREAVTHFKVKNPLPPTSDFYLLQKEALSNRPEILEQDADVSAARKGIMVARSGLLPSLSLGYDYSYTPDVGFLSPAHSSYGTLTLSFPIFDSGAERGKVQQASAQLATAETNRRTQIDSVMLELQQAYTNRQAAELSIVALGQALAQADEAYQLARLRYTTGVTAQSGVSPIVELSNAQNTLSQAQSNYVTALYSYNSDLAAVDKAVGKYSYASPKLGFGAPPSLSSLGGGAKR
jgi:outer membrane protein